MFAIELKHVFKTFTVPAGKWFIFTKWKKKTILKNISFNIKRGEFIGLLGPNGSGKTTTTKIISGILKADKGHIRVLGYDPHKKEKDFLRRIGVMFGNRTNLIFDIPLIESLKLMKDIYNLSDEFFNERLNYLTDLLDMKHLIDFPVRKMSFGQRMKSELLVTFLHKPELVILDEPTIGLDPVVKENVRVFLRYINKHERTTIILTTHNIGDVEMLCKRIIILKNGTIIWNGLTDKLKKKYITYKKVNVDIERIKSKSKFKTFVKQYNVKRVGSELIFNIKRKEEGNMIENLNDVVDFDSITIKEPELEEIIKQIYSG